MTTLYTYAGSANGYKIELAFSHLDVRYRRVEVDIFSGGAATPEFLQKNPNGRVPVLELDDGACIAESNAILFHVARGTALLADDPLAQTQVLSWLFFEQNLVEPVLGSARFWKLTGRDLGREDELARRIEGTRAACAVLERALGTREWLTGTQLSIADLGVYAYTHLAGEVGVSLDNYRAVAAWCHRIEGLPRHIPGPAPYGANARAANARAASAASPT